ncbi:transcriptional regulator [Wenxinia saemankumensis]|uniref:Transcriptional regulator, RpiR family n=1 Tax=Wenxinia saemankumensis TaxID=1447782 RepID=A0A1M6HP86_9RHOB|nr:transcriptional regulator [Wenxinia saemankumensis]SHJ23999.1 transcriptional regulator, RpiR family [Wenxinia saemankumensis]
MPDTPAPDDLMAAIAHQRGGLSPKLRAIAGFALDEPERFIRNTSREICGVLGTSEPTLIRFCQIFGYSGLSDFRIDLALALARSARPGGFVEPLAGDRRRVNHAAKAAIARAAVPLIAGDRSLLIDNGSTAELFAMRLDEAPPLTVMTSGLMVAQHLLGHGRHSVMLTGGRIRPESLALTGRAAEQLLATMRFDTLVMGADSIDPAQGLSTFLEDEAHQTRAMVEAANRVIVLADRTKFLKSSLHWICALEKVAILVTDLAPGDPLIPRMEEKGVQVVLVDPAATKEPA